MKALLWCMILNTWQGITALFFFSGVKSKKKKKEKKLTFLSGSFYFSFTKYVFRELSFLEQ